MIQFLSNKMAAIKKMSKMLSMSDHLNADEAGDGTLVALGHAGLGDHEREANLIGLGANVIIYIFLQNFHRK
jgi:hypothetical protein